MTNEELRELVDTTDEWIVERTGIRERRIAQPEEAMTDIAFPRASARSRWPASTPATIDLLIVATVTPDMAFPSTGALLADQLGMPDAAAYDLSAGCTGFMYAIAQALRDARRRARQRALVVGGDVLSKILDWTTARRSSSSATAQARSCSRRRPGRIPRVRARGRRRRRR